MAAGTPLWDAAGNLLPPQGSLEDAFKLFTETSPLGIFDLQSQKALRTVCRANKGIVQAFFPRWEWQPPLAALQHLNPELLAPNNPQEPT